MQLNLMHTIVWKLRSAGGWNVAALSAVLMACTSGCYQSNLNREVPIEAAAKADTTPDSDKVLAKLDEALDLTFEKRRLSLRDNAAWQIVHGILAFDRAFKIEDKQGQMVPALEYLLNGGEMDGWTD